MAIFHTLVFDSNSSARLDIRPLTGNCRFNNSSISSVTKIFVTRGPIQNTNAWTASLTGSDTLKVRDTSNNVISTFTVSSVSQSSNSDNFFATVDVTSPSGFIPADSQIIRFFVAITQSGAAALSSDFSTTALGVKLKTADVNLSSISTLSADADTNDRYVVADYVDAGYIINVFQGSKILSSVASISATATRIRPAAIAMQAFDTVLYVGGRLRFATVAISTNLTSTAVADKFSGAQANLTSISTLSADWNYNPNYVEVGYVDVDYIQAPGQVKSAAAALTAITSVTATSSRTTRNNLTAFSAVSLTSLAVVKRNAAVLMSAFNTVVSAGGRIRPGQTALTAFNTVVSAAGRIRPGVDISGLAFTLSATPYNFTKASASLTNTFTVAPNGGKIFGGILQGASPIPYSQLHYKNNFYSYINAVGYVTQDPLGGETGGKVFAFWADARDGGGVVATSPAGIPITIYEDTDYFAISLENGVLSMTMQSATVSWYVPTQGWHHYLINMQYGGGEIRAYVNGVQASTNQSGGGLTAIIPNFLYIGDTFEGSIAQFWLGKTVINELTYWYNNGFVDMGVTGITDAQTTGEGVPYQTVYYYDRLGYNNTNAIKVNDLNSRWTATYNNQAFTYIAPNGISFAKDNIYINLPTIVARLIATGDNIVGAEPFTLTAILTLTANIRYVIKAAAALTSLATVTARLSQVLPSSASLTCQATFTANTYQFTKAGTTLSSAFTLTANADEISSGIVLSLGSFSLTPAGNVIRDSKTSVASILTLTANAADRNMGEAVLSSAFTFSATSRVTYPIRPTASLSMAFSVVATSKRFRDSPVPLSTAFTFANGITRALKSGVVAMSAFDTVLSAGKLIEFLAENTIIVTNEQRLLRAALESTVLLVQMANGVNTITAETTDIVVPQEQGVLLAQYNIPTN